MREKEEFRISLPLVYLIQQITKQSTPEILSQIRLLQGQLLAGAPEKFRELGTKELRGFWPDTEIFFRLRVHCWRQRVYVSFEMPSQTKKVSGEDIDDCVADEQLLDGKLPSFTRPTVKTPRGMKRMD